MDSPKIRFKGYTDAWEQRKLNEICEYTSSSLSAKNALESGEYALYDANEQIGYVNSFCVSKKYITVIKDGAGVGRIRKLPKNTAFIGTMGALTSKNNKLDFLYYLLEKKDLSKQYTGSTIPHIYFKDYGNDNISISSNEEQQKIGEYFTSLDNLITLHQRKCEQTKKLKKFMLQKMFPKDGANVPEIRFSGFTDAWEQRKLSELSSSFEYGLNAAAKEFDGENKYIRITDIDDSTREFLQYDLTSPDISLEGAENYQLKDGDIVFARTGASVGKTYIYKESDGLVYYAGFLIRARVKSEYSAEFIFQNTLTEGYEKFIRITSQRSGQPGVNAQEYGDFDIFVPSFEEQEKIGQYFRNIDDLITLHQRKYEELQKIKKFMLQNLFV